MLKHKRCMYHVASPVSWPKPSPISRCLARISSRCLKAVACKKRAKGLASLQPGACDAAVCDSAWKWGSARQDLIQKSNESNLGAHLPCSHAVEIQWLWLENSTMPCHPTSSSFSLCFRLRLFSIRAAVAEHVVFVVFAISLPLTSLLNFWRQKLQRKVKLPAFSEAASEANLSYRAFYCGWSMALLRFECSRSDSNMKQAHATPLPHPVFLTFNTFEPWRKPSYKKKRLVEQEAKGACRMWAPCRVRCRSHLLTPQSSDIFFHFSSLLSSSHLSFSRVSSSRLSSLQLMSSHLSFPLLSSFQLIPAHLSSFRLFSSRLSFSHLFWAHLKSS